MATRSKSADALLTTGIMAAFVGFVSLLVAGLAWTGARGRNQTKVALGSRLVLAGAPGDTLGFSITGTRSIDRRWASDTGLTMTIGGKSYVVAKPREKKWGDSIQFGNSSDFGLKIDGRLLVPDAEQGTTLQGAIRGDITYPEGTGGRTFSNHSARVDIPVTLRVVSRAEADRLGAARGGLAPVVLKGS